MTSKPLSAMAEDPKGIRLELLIITAMVVGPGYACIASYLTRTILSKTHMHDASVTTSISKPCQSSRCMHAKPAVVT